MKPARLDLGAIRAALADPILVARMLGLDDGAQRQAGGVLVRCPAHGDRTPSCSLTFGDDRTLRVRCFGCALGGDVFTLIASVEGLDVRRDFKRVLARAADLANVDAFATPAPALSRTRAAPHRAPPDLRVALDDAELTTCTRALDEPGAEEVRAYLERRGLLVAARDELRAFDVGEIAYRIDERLALGGSPRELERLWLVRHDVARGWIPMWREHALVIPWRAPDGALDTVQRRLISDECSPRYVCGRAPRWPYGIERVRHASPEAPIAFVEGALDVLAYRALYPERIALGLPGVEGWDARWSELARGRVAFVALDADDAGDRKAKQVAPLLYAADAREVFRERPHGAKDWAARLRARGAS